MAFSLPDSLLQNAPRAEPTLAELRAARADLELDIQAAVATLVRNFKDATGVSPAAVDVQMQRLWPTDQPHPVHAVIGVRVALDV
jgi:hypothetical protein